MQIASIRLAKKEEENIKYQGEKEKHIHHHRVAFNKEQDQTGDACKGKTNDDGRHQIGAPMKEKTIRTFRLSAYTRMEKSPIDTNPEAKESHNQGQKSPDQ